MSSGDDKDVDSLPTSSECSSDLDDIPLCEMDQDDMDIAPSRPNPALMASLTLSRELSDAADINSPGGEPLNALPLGIPSPRFAPPGNHDSQSSASGAERTRSPTLHSGSRLRNDSLSPPSPALPQRPVPPVPAFSLPPPPGGGQPAPALEASGSKPPALQLPFNLVAGRTPECSPGPMSVAGPSPSVRGVLQGATPTTSGRLQVDLLSHAFMLDARYLDKGYSKGLSIAELLSQRACTALGVVQEDIKFFELREIHDLGDVKLDKQRIGMAVDRSTFSLQALEELILDNKALTAAAQSSVQTLQSLQRDYSEKEHELLRKQMRVAEYEADARRMQERNRSLEKENALLRQQLQRSDSLRLQGQKALDELKREFEALTRDIAADGLLPVTSSAIGLGFRGDSKALISPRVSSTVSLPSPRGVPPPSAGLHGPTSPNGSARLGALLNRLSDGATLGQLEAVLDRVAGVPAAPGQSAGATPRVTSNAS